MCLGGEDIRQLVEGSPAEDDMGHHLEITKHVNLFRFVNAVGDGWASVDMNLGYEAWVGYIRK